jgi:hyaluronan synthase
LTMDLLTRFNNQYYCRWKVEPGDDRHLTNLIMNDGHRSVQIPFAIALTESPESFFRFLTQQLRWMRSFYREQVWQVRSIPHQNIYLIWVTSYELLFPFFIITAFIYHYLQDDAFLLLMRRIFISIIIIIIRTLFLLWFNHFDLDYIYNLYYFPFYFIFLLPIKLYSILTCYRMQWITSERKNNNKLTSLFCEKVMITIFIFFWNCFLGFSCVHFYFLNHSLDNIFKISF